MTPKRAFHAHRTRISGSNPTFPGFRKVRTDAVSTPAPVPRAMVRLSRSTPVLRAISTSQLHEHGECVSGGHVGGVVRRCAMTGAIRVPTLAWSDHAPGAEQELAVLCASHQRGSRGGEFTKTCKLCEWAVRVGTFRRGHFLPRRGERRVGSTNVCAACERCPRGWSVLPDLSDHQGAEGYSSAGDTDSY